MSLMEPGSSDSSSSRTEWVDWFESVPTSAPRYSALDQVLSMAYDNAERVRLVESVLELGARQAYMLARRVSAINETLPDSEISLPTSTQCLLYRTIGAARGSEQVDDALLERFTSFLSSARREQRLKANLNRPHSAPLVSLASIRHCKPNALDEKKDLRSGTAHNPGGSIQRTYKSFLGGMQISDLAKPEENEVAKELLLTDESPQWRRACSAFVQSYERRQGLKQSGRTLACCGSGAVLRPKKPVRRAAMEISREILPLQTLPEDEEISTSGTQYSPLSESMTLTETDNHNSSRPVSRGKYDSVSLHDYDTDSDIDELVYGSVVCAVTM